MKNFPNDFSQLLCSFKPPNPTYSIMRRSVSSRDIVFNPRNYSTGLWIHPKQIQISVMAQTPDFKTSMPAAK